MRLKCKLIDKIHADDTWIAIVESEQIPQSIKIEVPYPDDIEKCSEFYIVFEQE